MSRVLAEAREVRLGPGLLRYRDEGTGPALLFVHGILVNGSLWRKVVPLLSGRFRCVVPDLPLGGHAVPMRPEADLSPKGAARIVADLMEALDLRDVTLVGNDTGGAICQILIAERPDRIGRLVLTNCDAYESFFPLPFSFFSYAPRLFGQRFTDLLAWILRARTAQRLLLKSVSRSRPDDAVLGAYFEHLIRDARVRCDLTRFLCVVSKRDTLKAAKSFASFRLPVLIAWGKDDILFPSRLARRLRQDFPDARLEFIPSSRAFVPEDQPERLAGLISDFLEPRTAATEYRPGAEGR